LGRSAIKKKDKHIGMTNVKYSHLCLFIFGSLIALSVILSIERLNS